MGEPLRKVTAPIVRSMKAKGQKVVCLTAYDHTSGLLSDASGADVVLVGDSLGTVIQGKPTTTSVTLEDVCYHVRATRGAVERAILVADLPFGSYGSSVGQAVESSARLVQSGAEAVKLEGIYVDECRAILKTGVPVMGHIGMTPQSVNAFGGHRVQGKGDAAGTLVEQAKMLEDAGVFGIVLELVPAETAKAITESVRVPTIGIGAGPHCDGQIQVFHDLLGLWERQFKHVRRYCHGRSVFLRSLKKYGAEVRAGEFPTGDHSF